MDNLFGSIDAVSVGDIEELNRVSSEFKCWAFRALASGKLETFVGALLRTRRAATPQEALQYLADVSASRSVRVSVAQLDFTGTKGNVLRRLQELFCESRENDADIASEALYRFHGTVGHIAIPDLFTRWLGSKPRHNHQYSGSDSQFIFEFAQRKMPGVQLGFFEDDEWNGMEVTKYAPMTKRFISGLLVQWERMARELQDGSLWFEHYYRLTPLMPRLRSFLLPLFGSHMRYLVARGNSHIEYLFQLTIMSWATAALYAARAGSRVLFRELPVLASSHGVSGGRIDALEVSSLDGAPPDKKATSMLTELALRERMERASVGKVLYDIERLFHGRQFDVRILDWKFAVGDAQRACDIITSVKKPLDRHVKQMQRYLTFAALDYYFVSLRRSRLHTWAAFPHKQIGELVYFLPSEPAITHAVSLSPSERELVFGREVVSRWSTAEGRARIRELENLLVGHIRELVREKRENGANGDKFRAPLWNGTVNHSQLPLFNFDKPISVREVIESHRRFADDGRVMEIVGEEERGGIRYALHVGNLARALTSGALKVKHRFDWIRGGKVTCPVHPDEDEDPSFHVYPERRFAKCFSCGAFARFDEWSIPETLVLPSVTVASAAVPRGMRTIEIPERHNAVMHLARVALSLRFSGSAGERYLREERRLDVARAIDHDIGYWDDNVLVNDLLDMRISFEELVHYGFFGFSDRVRDDSTLFRLLLRRGMARSDIERRSSRNGKEVLELPYSLLDGMVTFPLTIAGKMTSLYGRDVRNRGKTFTHRKLSTAHTNVPHGIFNEYPLTDTLCDEIVLVEAPIDALSLREMGHHDTVALVGIKNYIILELIARTGKRVAIALDNDVAGINNTYGYEQSMKAANGTVQTRHMIGVMEWFAKNGLDGKIRDFTAAFRTDHSNEEGWDDWNTWWKLFGPRREAPFSKVIQ